MRKFLRKIFLNNFKNIFFMIVNSDSKYFEFNKIELKIKKKSKLGNKDDKLITRFDQIITPKVLNTGEWEYFIIKFILKYSKNKNYEYHFFDIGSNIGLISKQLLIKNNSIKRFHCIEPEKNNFEIMKNNLIKFKNVSFYNFALTNKKLKKKKIFLNMENFGDFSLLKNFNNYYSYIDTVNINSFFKKIILKYKIKNIIYKSDTQGFDESLIFSLDKKILNRIDILILEISNFKYLMKNKNKLINIIKDFKIIEDEKGQKINLDMILRKINKQKEFNLLISRY